jgi:manganese transport protein
MVTSSRARMGDYANPLWVKLIGYSICSVIAGLNVYLLWETIGPVWVGAIAAVMLAFTGYVRFVYTAPATVIPARSTD